MQLPAAISFPSTAAEVAYDHWRDRLVRFGGQFTYISTALLHTFDGSTWTQQTASPTPPARGGHRLVFDEARGVTLLVGGGIFGPTFFFDTWVWNGSTWQELFPLHPSPGGYASHTLTYDEARERVVYVGPVSVFEWDGSDWSDVTPTTMPPLRYYHAAAYDSRRQRVVMAGGRDASFTPMTDVWEWDGAVWQQRSTTMPVVWQPQMVFDRERGVLLVAGATGDCHEFDGTSWQVASSLAPGDFRLAYDRQRGRAIAVYGQAQTGSAPSGSTWVYQDASLAVAQPYGIGCGNPRLIAREDPGARPLLGMPFGVDIEHATAGVAFMCLGWSSDSVLGLPLPYPMQDFGLPGCWLLQSDEAIALPCATTGPDSARFTLNLPAAPAYLGLSFFLQPWTPVPGLNPAGAAVANGIAVTIGSH